MTRRKVRLTAKARTQLRLFKDWWGENAVRPEILSTDLTAALEMVSIAPGIGSPYRQSPIFGVRRLYLGRLMSHLYYTFDEREVVIRAFWHARRGAGPDLGL